MVCSIILNESEEINSLKALMRNKSVIIQKADKGNTDKKTDVEKYCIINVEKKI